MDEEEIAQQDLLYKMYMCYVTSFDEDGVAILRRGDEFEVLQEIKDLARQGADFGNDAVTMQRAQICDHSEIIKFLIKHGSNYCNEDGYMNDETLLDAAGCGRLKMSNPTRR